MEGFSRSTERHVNNGGVLSPVDEPDFYVHPFILSSHHISWALTYSTVLESCPFFSSYSSVSFGMLISGHGRVVPDRFDLIDMNDSTVKAKEVMFEQVSPKPAIPTEWSNLISQLSFIQIHSFAGVSGNGEAEKCKQRVHYKPYFINYYVCLVHLLGV